MQESHQFSDAEVASTLYPWGIVEYVPPTPFDLDACIERYADDIPMRASTRAHPWRDTYTRKLSKKRGVVSDEEARFWFWALTSPQRLVAERAQPGLERLRDFDPNDTLDVPRRFRDWIEAFEAQYDNLRLYTQAYLARLMLQLVGLENTLEVLLATLDDAWLKSFLDELYPSPNDDRAALFEIADRWLARSPKIIQTDRRKHQADVRAATQSVLPLAGSPAAVRAYLVDALTAPPKSEAALYHVLAAEPDDDRFFEFLERYKPDLGRREVVLVVGRLSFQACEWISKRVRASRRPSEVGLPSALAKVRSPRVVPALLHLAEQTTTAVETRKLLEEIDLPYACGLVEVAAGQTKSRALAAELLAELAERNAELYDRALLQTDAGEAVRRKVDEERTELPELPREDWTSAMRDLWVDGRPRGLPAFCAAKRLPSIAHVDGSHVLPLGVVFGMLLRLRDHDWTTGAGVFSIPLHGELDTDSAAEFAWSIFTDWTRNGFPPRHQWCMNALIEFPTTAHLVELAEQLQTWPPLGERQHSYAAIRLLEVCSDEIALTLLSRIGRTSNFKGLRNRATAALQRQAARRSISPAHLEDLAIDDCGLEPNGATTFDYGTRQFELRIDGELKPVIRSSDGKITKSLPRVRSTDDPLLVEAERQRFKVMKKRLRDVLKLQRGRLELSLGQQRQWRASHWRQYYADHPVMRHIVTRLLWSSTTDTNTQLFRVTAEGDLVDVRDEPLQLSANSSITLVHPLQLEKDVIDAWGAAFADYEIVPPFPQLERETYTSTDLSDWSEVRVASGWLRGHFTRCGWSKAPPVDGVMHHVYRPLPGGMRAYAELSPGLKIDYRADAPQCITSLYFGGQDEGLNLTVSAIVKSEAIYDVRRLLEAAQED